MRKPLPRSPKRDCGRGSVRAGMLLSMFAVCAEAYGQGGYRPGAQVATFHSEIDDSNQPYAIWVPRTIEAGKRYPLVVSLHSEESNHRLNLRQVFGVPVRFGESDTEDMRFFPAVHDPGFIVACPLARGTMGYQGIAEK